VTDQPVSDRILTIPNLVSALRLVGVGVFWWVLVVEENVALAAWLIFIIGWTDWVDGYLARRLGQVSRLGKALDPVADRVMIFSAVVGGLIVGVLPVWFGGALIAREALMAVVTGVLWARGHATLEVRWVGKAATFLLYGAIPAFYLAAADFLPGLMRPVAWMTGVAGLALYWYAAFLYVGDARRIMAAVESAAPRTEIDERTR
jgi:cardiolipin synthase